MITCIQEASQEATCTKRKAQRLIGSFIEYLDRMGLERLTDTVREILDYVWLRVKIKDVEDNNSIVVQNTNPCYQGISLPNRHLCVKEARSFDYIVVGISEYCSSKTCPD
ncbi:hypothetical protein BGZ93_011312 [Podila epicladia]|nr:hypothetical protein BGZ92_000331 [Podila epicladia]KAG0098490.1 hypothetical protein BGZ93_011312 [Podila epicladia]